MDTIIVNTNEDMERIISWAEPYRDGVKMGAIRFNSPFSEGTILFKEEKIKVKFKSNEDNTDFIVYISDDFNEMGSFTWRTDTFEAINKSFRGKSGKANTMLSAVESFDNMYWKIGVKYMSLMLFAAYYRPEFESNRKVVGGKNRKPSKNKGKKSRNRTLYNKLYIISDSNVSLLPKEKRKIKKCDHEFSVRGHYRRYKSGKVGWVSAYRKNVGKKKEEDRNYIAKIKE